MFKILTPKKNIIYIFSYCTLLLSACGSSGGEKSVTPSANPPAATPTVTRNEATYQQLTSTAQLTFSTSAFLPDNASPATNIFEGNLVITGTPTFKQNYGNETDLPTGYKIWPEFNVEFIQDNGRLTPTDRGHGFIGNGAWSITAGVGAVWDEASDNSYTRAAFPYTIKENNTNCEANGLATFLFKSDGSTSNIQVQNIAETCIFYGFEFYGMLTASYNTHDVSNKAQVINERNNEETARIPTKPLAQLAIDYPNVNLSNYGYAIEPEDLNGYSILVNSTSYIDGCTTRYGEHPYCSEKTIGIYSFTKSIHAFMLVAALEKQYPNFKNQLIKDLVPECSDSRWDGVTVENALDMATGNYNSLAFEADESSDEIENNYFLKSTRADRANFTCNGWTHQVTAATNSVYHTTDTELVGYAANQFVKNKLGNNADAFNDILIPLYNRIGLSQYIHGIQRTTDTQEAWGGYGLSATLNDVVRVAQYLRDDAINDGLLDETMVHEVLSAAPQGLYAQTANLNYDNGFWRFHAGTISNMSACGASTQVPFLSGFGGHASVILPKVIITQMTDGGGIGFLKTLNDVFANIDNTCPSQ
ncbi:MAG: hypothetical protein JKX78_13940 [Alteromonadaceae bacterium]|nr:hypothetical protein [Alteromonadaceae bacterium]